MSECTGLPAYQAAGLPGSRDVRRLKILIFGTGNADIYEEYLALLDGDLEFNLTLVNQGPDTMYDVCLREYLCFCRVQFGSRTILVFIFCHPFDIKHCALINVSPMSAN